MLPDNERKILHVFVNLMMKRTPSVEDICRRTGKSREAVTAALKSLNQKGYIWRNEKGEVQAMRPEQLERPDRPKANIINKSSHHRHRDYW